MNIKLEYIIKVSLSVFMFLCLFDMPYEFYQLVRFVSFFGFAILAYKSHQKENEIETVVYACLALLFQPFLKITLGRDLWNIVDVIVGAGLLLSIINRRKSKK